MKLYKRGLKGKPLRRRVNLRRNTDWRIRIKKKLEWHSTFGAILIQEQSYRFRDKSGSRFRPFSESAELRNRCYSRRLQRVLCDFGADCAFGGVNAKLCEHYGIVVPGSAPRRFTEHHAKQISDRKDLGKGPAEVKVSRVIAECDGSMVPIVTRCTEVDCLDRRKKKTLSWKEARLALAHAEGSEKLFFAGTMESVNRAGEQLLWCVEQAGGHPKTKVHCVGDGAVWIANQVEEQFGANGTYLIDFCHLCEYLSAAAPSCSGGNDSTWLTTQKERMKQNQHQQVLTTLQPYVEVQDTAESATPVKACYRYIKNRLEQLDYRSAIDQNLPIGSGEIESAHRYVIQKRLKLPGAWWTLENAKDMINLRTCRANEVWDDYWKEAA